MLRIGAGLLLGSIVVLLGSGCGTDDHAVSTGRSATATPISATVTGARGQVATPTMVADASPTSAASGEIGLPLPAGLELLDSGHLNPAATNGQMDASATASAYLSQDDSDTLYQFFIDRLEADGWSILDASNSAGAEAEREISSLKDDRLFLVELWDLSNSDASELTATLSMLWTMDVEPQQLSQGETFVFTAMLPCSPDAPVECE